MKSKLRPADKIYEETMTAREDCHQEMMGKIADKIEAEKSCGRCIVRILLPEFRFHFDILRVTTELKNAGYNISANETELIINWRTAKSTL